MSVQRVGCGSVGEFEVGIKKSDLENYFFNGGCKFPRRWYDMVNSTFLIVAYVSTPRDDPWMKNPI